jgi:hypothetical protein
LLILLIVACPRRSQRCIRFHRLQDHCLFSRRRHQYRFYYRRLSFAAVAAIVSTITATASVSTATPQSFLSTPPFPLPLLLLAVLACASGEQW